MSEQGNTKYSTFNIQYHKPDLPNPIIFLNITAMEYANGRENIS